MPTRTKYISYIHTYTLDTVHVTIYPSARTQATSYTNGKDDICCGNHSHPLIINPTYSSLFLNIKKVTILLRVKNSTAFATDDEFDRNKRVHNVINWSGGGRRLSRHHCPSQAHSDRQYPLTNTNIQLWSKEEKRKGTLQYNYSGGRKQH
jgi:hypothetical protein